MNKDYDKGIAYVTAMRKKSSQIKLHTYSGNKLLDVVLHSLQCSFDMKLIEIKYERIEDFDFKNECLYDLNAVLYNVLDNAIESCNLLHGGMIRITFVREQTNYVIFKVVNTAVIENNDILETHKDNKEQHGIGTQSIKDAVDRLGGTVDFSYDHHLHVFTTIVYIKYRQ